MGSKKMPEFEHHEIDPEQMKKILDMLGMSQDKQDRLMSGDPEWWETQWKYPGLDPSTLIGGCCFFQVNPTDPSKGIWASGCDSQGHEARRIMPDDPAFRDLSTQVFRQANHPAMVLCLN